MSVIERTHVDLDVHARAVVSAAVDSLTGELIQRRLNANPTEVPPWGELLLFSGRLIASPKLSDSSPVQTRAAVPTR
jgi:hypothetical protein